MSEQHPESPAPVPPTSAPPGYAPPTFAAPAAPAPAAAPVPDAAPSFAPPQTAAVTGYTPPNVAPAAPAPAAPAPAAAPSYQPPAAAPDFQAPGAAPSYHAPSYQAPAAAPSYPTPTAAPSYPTPTAAPAGAVAWDAAPAAPATEAPLEDDTPENVGRGLLFALGGVVAGIVLAIFLWQMGFVAAITGAVMAYACVWLYVKGAGRSPRKGAIGLLILIVVGVLLSLVGAIGSDAVIVARKVFPNNTALQMEAVVRYLTTVKVWTANGAAVAMYLGFAVLGSFSIFAGLAKARKAG